jgi:hypothetical protein
MHVFSSRHCVLRNTSCGSVAPPLGYITSAAAAAVPPLPHLGLIFAAQQAALEALLEVFKVAVQHLVRCLHFGLAVDSAAGGSSMQQLQSHDQCSANCSIICWWVDLKTACRSSFAVSELLQIAVAASACLSGTSNFKSMLLLLLIRPHG